MQLPRDPRAAGRVPQRRTKQVIAELKNTLNVLGKTLFTKGGKHMSGADASHRHQLRRAGVRGHMPTINAALDHGMANHGVRKQLTESILAQRGLRMRPCDDPHGIRAKLKAIDLEGPPQWRCNHGALAKAWDKATASCGEGHGAGGSGEGPVAPEGDDRGPPPGSRGREEALDEDPSFREPKSPLGRAGTFISVFFISHGFWSVPERE